MNNKKHLILLIFGLVAIFVASTFFYYRDQEPKIDPSIFSDRNKALEYADRIKVIKDKGVQDQILAAIIETGEIDRCTVAAGVIVGGVDYETVCRNNIALSQAIQTQDISFCSKLDDTLMSRADCRSQVLLSKAVDSNNITGCLGASSAEKLNCETSFWFYRAVEEKKINYCENWPKDQIGNCQTRYSIRLIQTSPEEVACGILSEKNDCETTKRIINEGSKREGCSLVNHPGWRMACYQTNPI